jgi:5-formyltetrahydrofolate cyclo-ligase
MPPFEPSDIAELTETAKRELRKRMRALRSAHPADALQRRGQSLVTRALQMPEFLAARSVALYFPMLERKEVDLREIDRQARLQGKRVYYPFLEPRDGGLVSGLRLALGMDELIDRGQRFFEPPPDAPVAARGDVDLAFVPALAVAASGHRLGYGAGFYDSLLPDVCPPAQAVAVAYDFQLLAELPCLPHDVACDWILTDARLLRAVAP